MCNFFLWKKNKLVFIFFNDFHGKILFNLEFVFKKFCKPSKAISKVVLGRQCSKIVNIGGDIFKRDLKMSIGKSVESNTKKSSTLKDITMKAGASGVYWKVSQNFFPKALSSIKSNQKTHAKLCNLVRNLKVQPYQRVLKRLIKNSKGWALGSFVQRDYLVKYNLTFRVIFKYVFIIEVFFKKFLRKNVVCWISSFSSDRTSFKGWTDWREKEPLMYIKTSIPKIRHWLYIS